MRLLPTSSSLLRSSGCRRSRLRSRLVPRHGRIGRGPVPAVRATPVLRGICGGPVGRRFHPTLPPRCGAAVRRSAVPQPVPSMDKDPRLRRDGGTRASRPALVHGARRGGGAVDVGGGRRRPAWAAAGVSTAGIGRRVGSRRLADGLWFHRLWLPVRRNLRHRRGRHPFPRPARSAGAWPGSPPARSGAWAAWRPAGSATGPSCQSSPAWPWRCRWRECCWCAPRTSPCRSPPSPGSSCTPPCSALPPSSWACRSPSFSDGRRHPPISPWGGRQTAPPRSSLLPRRRSLQCRPGCRSSWSSPEPATSWPRPRWPSSPDAACHGGFR